MWRARGVGCLGVYYYFFLFPVLDLGTLDFLFLTFPMHIRVGSVGELGFHLVVLLFLFSFCLHNHPPFYRNLSFVGIFLYNFCIFTLSTNYG